MTPVSFNTGIAITTSDTADFGPFLATERLTDAIYVGVSGNLVAVWQDGTTTTFTAAAGGVLPIAVRRINATNTTADDLVALYEV